jgi:hypothetical protein
MAYNVPSYDTNKFSIGPGILYIGPSGTEPTVDIGAVRSGMSIVTTREKVDVFQGIPATLVKTYALKETGVLTIMGLEWNLNRLSDALGAGSVSSDATNDIFDFGGEMTFTNVTLKFVHTNPEGKVITVKIWTARGNGEVALNFGDDVHEIPFTFDMLLSTTDWNGAALAEGKQLYQVTIQR